MATQTIDLNRCSAGDLKEANIPQVNEERAEALVEYREENGPFESWDEVSKVPGFNQGMIENLKKAGVTIGGAMEEE